MNVAHIEEFITDCRDCRFCDDNGEFASKKIWLCAHDKVQKENTNDENIKHWYDYAVIAPVRVRKPEVPVPNWCPFVKK